jgi:RNA polymerase sigma-70 factor (ECF subfamily)
MVEASDEKLMELFLEGDRKAFEELVHRYETQLVNFLYRYLSDTGEAEEAFQETFIRVYTKAESFDREKKFKTWLYTIAINLARTALKRRRAAPLLAREQESQEAQDRTVLEGQAAAGDSPERTQESTETGELIKRAVMSLPQKQREVFVLCQYQGLSHAEIASILDRPVGTIKSQMHYAVVALREKLREVYPMA